MENKLDKSRKERSTVCFFDEDYWGEEEQKRLGTTYTENDKQVKIEVDKKWNFIKKYMGGVKNILVVGCSFGFLVAKLRDEGLEALGIDISQPALDRAPERIKPYLKNMDIRDICSWGDDKFELVIAFDVLEHLYIEDIFRAIKEMNRVASRFILIRLPVPSYRAELWVADSSFKTHDKSHISCYPYEFWVRRFEELEKFQWHFAHLHNCYVKNDPEYCEAWIVFQRKI